MVNSAHPKNLEKYALKMNTPMGILARLKWVKENQVHRMSTALRGNEVAII
jgi:hypothetical protein